MATFVGLIFGNIGAGKSSLIEYIEGHSKEFNDFLNQGEKVTTVKEFIDPIALQLFYHDRKAYSEIFEESCLVGRKTRHLKAKHDSGIYFFDRGMIEGAETFCKNSFQEGYLSHEAYFKYIASLQRGLDLLDRSEQKSWLEQLVVYLQVEDVKILQQRQRKRNTKGEEIPFEYLQRINQLYDEFFGNVNEVYHKYNVVPPQVIKVDASVNFNEDTEYHQNILNRIIKKLTPVRLKKNEP